LYFSDGSSYFPFPLFLLCDMLLLYFCDRFAKAGGPPSMFCCTLGGILQRFWWRCPLLFVCIGVFRRRKSSKLKRKVFLVYPAWLSSLGSLSAIDGEAASSILFSRYRLLAGIRLSGLHFPLHFPLDLRLRSHHISDISAGLCVAGKVQVRIV
jgi:hypothetical protein